MFILSSDGLLYALAGTSPLAKARGPSLEGNPANRGSQELQGGAPQIRVQSGSGLSGWKAGPLSLSVLAGGAQPLNYQWSFNGQPLNGARTAALIQDALTPQKVGAVPECGSANTFGFVDSAEINVQIGYRLNPVTVGPSGTSPHGAQR